METFLFFSDAVASFLKKSTAPFPSVLKIRGDKKISVHSAKRLDK